jgi:hypothetical protein
MSLILDGTNGVSDIDGTAATPALRGGDANTGIFFPAADTIAFSEGGVESMRINSDGILLVGKTTNDNINAGLVLNSVPTGGYGRINFIKSTASGTGSTNNCVFYYNNSIVGNITSTSTVTAYNTSSDYRLKDNIAPMTNALAVVQALKPVTYKWKSDGSNCQGFIAHELQAVVPECVTGEKDAVDSEGNPKYQGIDTSFLVATLTAAIQELKAELDSVKVELAALKA